MAGHIGTNLTTNGLALHLDLANTRSYAGTGGTGSIIYDLSPSGYNGVIGGTISLTFSNGALEFDGKNNQLINLGKVTPLLYPGTNDYTWSAWLKPNTKPGTGQVWFGQAGGGILGFGIQVVHVPPTEPYVLVEIRGNNGNRQRKFFGVPFQGQSGQVLTDSWGKWQHYAFVINRLAGLNQDGFYTMNFYLGGVSASTFTFSEWGSIIQQPAYAAVIGSHGDNPEYPPHPQYLYSGSIATVMVYGRALNASEISQNYNSTKARFGI